MRKIGLTLMLSLFVLCNVNAQITTYFYGRNKVQSKNETAALYSVAIYENNTRVTVELIPTKNRSRMNFWTSRNTYIVIGDDMELPILGFERKENGESIVDTRPFSGDWGWSNVKKGEKYYYTMVFAGKIPPGITNFTLKDKGSYTGAHGYGFSNYQLNNPRTGSTSWSEYSIKQFSDSNNDGICGIYEEADEQGYKLGCIKQNGEYRLIYLGSKERMSWWQIGDTKAVLRSSATNGFFKADWYMADKTSNSDCYIIFDGGSMKTIIDNDETFFLKMYPTSSTDTDISSQKEEWSGTGFALKNGYVVTNYHVIENAKSIIIQGINGDFAKRYEATIVATDKYNDLALLQIIDNSFKGFGTIPYSVKTTVSEVGEDIFVLGYPLTSTMGDEIKLTTGVISSKTGYQGDVSLYQISAPIQPGNSGGPLFDNKGNLVGIVNAKHKGAENVGYAIKTSYLKNLIESSISTSILPNNNQTAGFPLTGKVKSLKNYVFMISCSNQENSNTNSQKRIDNINNNQYFSNKSEIVIHNPMVSSNTLEDDRNYTFTSISRVTINEDHTIVELSLKNYLWCQIDPQTYIIANGRKYILTNVEGIAIAPQKTYPLHKGSDIDCKLYFPPIPKDIESFDLIESQSSRWKFYGIKIR